MRRWACEWLGAMTARGGYTLKGFVLITPGYHRVFDHWGQSELTIDRMIIQKGLSGTNFGRPDDVVGHQLFSNTPAFGGAGISGFVHFFGLPAFSTKLRRR